MPVPPPNSSDIPTNDADRRRRFDAPSDPHVLDFLILWGQYRWLTIVLVLLCGAGAFVLSSVMPKTFEAAAVVLPPDRASSADLLNRFQSSGALKLLKESENPSVDLLQNIVESRRISEGIASDPEVKSYYRAWIGPSGEFANARDWVRSTLSVEPGTSQLKIVATVLTGWSASYAEQDTAKKLAARIANLSYETMYNFFQDQLRSSARAARIAAQADAAMKSHELDSLEQARQEFEEQHKAVALTEQMHSLLSLEGELRGRVAVLRQKELVGARYMTTDANEQRELTDQVSAATQAMTEFEGSHALGPAISELPGITRMYAELERRIKALEPVVIFLRQEVEQESINETRERDVIQILDRATPPMKKSAPKRLVMLLLGLTIGGAISFMYLSAVVFVREMKERARYTKLEAPVGLVERA